ncbi:MAG: MBL fold metallo-hydrolase [Polyangiales bacterium]
MNAALAPITVAPGIRMLSLRTPTLPPALHTNAYSIGTHERVLVEPASPYEDEIAKTFAWVEDELAGGGVLRAVLLTHHHADHIGGADAVRRRFGVPIWAHARTAERLPGLSVDRVIDEGDVITLAGDTPMTLEPMHTPGHAPGHLCFFEPVSRALVAGDMVASVGTILIEPRDGDMQAYLASLARMRACAPALLLPSHGLPIVDACARLDFYVQHRLAREQKVARALASLGQAATLDALLPVAYDDAVQAVWPIARLSLESHLIKLARDGRVAQQGALWLATEP